MSRRQERAGRVSPSQPHLLPFAWLKQCWDAPLLHVRSCLLAKRLYRLRQQFGAAVAREVGFCCPKRSKLSKGNGRFSNTHAQVPLFLAQRAGLNTAFETNRPFSKFTKHAASELNAVLHCPDMGPVFIQKGSSPNIGFFISSTSRNATSAS